MSLRNTILSSLFICLAAPTLAHAEVGFESNAELKTAAVAKFIKEANNPRSATAKAIAKYNQDHSDGRNQDGVIDPKVTKDSVQVVTASAQEMHALWHYGSKVNGVCKAGGDSAKFMILLSAYEGVRSATIFGVMAFTVEAEQTFAAKILEDSDDLYCQDLDGNESYRKAFGPVKKSIRVSDVKAIALPQIDQ